VFFARRLAWGVVVIALTAFAAFGGLRALRPELFEGTGWWEGTRGDLERVFLRGDMGPACFNIGCPPLGDYMKTFWTADLWLLAGTFGFGIALGLLGGTWCAVRPRSRASRALEAFAALFYCTPVYVVGLGLLLLFAPVIGIFEVPVFFELHTYLSPTENPVTFLTAMAVPWLVSAAPLAAMIMRVTLGLIREVEEEDYVRTAFAKGLSRTRVVRRHAAPTAYVPVAALIGISVPLIVMNAILVETVFNIPGNFRFIRRAIVGPDPPGPNPDYESLQILSIYIAIFTVVITLCVDVAMAYLEPRLRRSAKPV
jgi:peptide/nickel transport system permease protein